jgi:hypothetical protein
MKQKHCDCCYCKSLAAPKPTFKFTLDGPLGFTKDQLRDIIKALNEAQQVTP